MAKKIRKEDIIDGSLLGSTIQETEELIKLIGTLKAELSKLRKDAKKDFKQNPLGKPEDIKKFNDQQSRINLLIKEGNRLRKAEAQAKTKLSALQSQENKNIQKTRLEINERNKVIRQNIQLQKTEAGSIKQLRIQLSKQTKAYDELSKAERENVKIGKVQLQQIQKTQTELRELEQATGRAQRNVGNYGDAWRGVGRVFSRGLGILGITAGIAGLTQMVRNGIAIVSGYSSANSKLAGILGVTKARTLDLQAQQKELGATTEFSAKQIATAQIELAKFGFAQQEIIASTSGLLSLASASGETLEGSASVLSATLRAFNIDASESNRVVDVMAKSFTSTSLDLEKFRESMKLVAPIAKSANIPLETTTALLGELANNGLSGSIAGTGLKNVISKLSNENSKLSKSLGFSVKNSEDLSKAFELMKERNIDLTEATELTDERSKAAFLTLVNGAESVDRLTESFKNASGAAEILAKENINNLEGDTKLLKSAWEGLVLTFSKGENFLRDIVQTATSFLGIITDLNTNIHEQSEAMEEQRIEVNLLVGRISELNEGTDERKKLIDELVRLQPNYLDGLDKENLSNEVLAKRLKEVNKQLVNQILLKQQDERIEAQGKEQAEAQRDLFEAEQKLRKEILIIRKAGFKGIEKETQLGKDQILQAKELLKILDEQAIRSKQQTAFGVTVEGANKQAKAYDKLLTLLNSVSQANRGINSENEIAKKLEQDRLELLKFLNIEEETYNDEVESGNDINEDANETTKETIGLINRLREEIQLLQKARDESGSEEDILKKQVEIKKLQDQLDALLGNKNKKKEAKELSDLQKAEIANATDLKDIERVLINSKEDNAEISRKLAEERIADLEEELKLIGDIEDAEEIRASKELEIAKLRDQISQDEIAKAKENEELKKEIANKAADESLDYFKKIQQEKISILDSEIEASKQKEQQLFSAAEKGNVLAEESIALERKNRAKLEEERLASARKIRNAELTLAGIRTLGAIASSGSDNPAQDTISQITLVSNFLKTLPAFIDGTEKVSDGVNGGVKISNGTDGYLARFDGDERILNPDQNGRVDGLSNEELTQAGELYKDGKFGYLNFKQSKYKTKNSADNSRMVAFAMSQMGKKLEEVNRSIKNIPSPVTEWNDVIKGISETTETANNIKIKHYKSKNLF
jgi:TP901 family phage tail tape measure protein